MAEVEKQNPLLQVFPREIWNLIAQKMNVQTFVKFRQALPESEEIINPSICVQKLFPEVFKVVYEKSFIRFEDAKICRNVCSSWMDGVDNYFQTKKFYSVKNIQGAKNLSAFFLKMPLEMIDINRIYELDLHPRCVSFGKKLVLKMQYDNLNVAVFPNHLREVNALLQSVRGFWEQFEHLEVCRTVRREAYIGNGYERRRNRFANNDFVTVPFGDIGYDVVSEASRADLANMHVDRANKNDEYWYELIRDEFDPNDFQMAIPFLHLMTNLKKISLLMRDRWILCQILLRIPRTENLEEIYVTPRMPHHLPIWFKCCAAVYKKCASNVCFLTAVNFRSLEILAYQSDARGGGGIPVFGKLKELHISIADYQEVVIMERLSCAEVVAIMFPNVKILRIGGDACKVPNDLWDKYANFINQFPTLEHFSLAGGCSPDWCESFKTICVGKTTTTQAVPVVDQDPTTSTSCSSSSSSKSSEKKTNGLVKFQISCPMHVPVRLLNMFPSVKHVIVEEWPKQCRRRVSKSKDRKYIKGFFQMFQRVSTLTFVPVTNCREIKNWLWGPGAVNWYRDDDWCQRRKRKIASSS